MKPNWFTKVKWFFLERVNWCHPVDRNGKEKTKTRFYTFYCYLFWPIPWQEPQPCWCCASVRGIAYGLVVGLLLGKMVYGL